MARFFLLGLSACLILAACVIIPIGFGEPIPFSVEDIKIGETTKQDLVETYGAAAQRYGEGEWWVYSVERKKSEWLVLIATPAGGGGGTFGGESEAYELVLWFDGETVKDFGITKSGSCDNDRNICSYGWPARTLIFLKDTDVDRSAKSVRGSMAHCRLYAFSFTLEDEFNATAVAYVDGERLGMLGHAGGYIYAELFPGVRRLSAYHDANPNHQNPESTVEFHCKSGERVYFAFGRSKSKNVWGEIPRVVERASPIDGEKLIRERWISITLTPDD